MKKLFPMVLATVFACLLLLPSQMASQTCTVSCPEGGVSVVLGGNEIACATPSPVNQALCLDSHELNYTSILNPTACDPPCANGGACVQYFVGASSQTSGAYCVCPVPWQGPTCQTNATKSCSCANSCGANTASCATTPCYNGGTCMMVNGAPLCFCASG